MSPRYTPDPSTASAGFPIFPRNDYTMKLGEPKAFLNHNNETNTDSHGVRYLLTCESDGEFKGKKQVYSCYQHSQGGLDFSKQFQMAAAGYTLKEESEFNEKAKAMDWSYDTDNGECGEGWRALMGQVVVASMSEGIQNQGARKGQPQQNWDGFRPAIG